MIGQATRRRGSASLYVALGLVVALVAGCGAAASPTPSPSGAPATPSPAPSAVPTATPTTAPSPTTAATPCPLTEVHGIALPSDQLVAVHSWTIGRLTQVTFALEGRSGDPLIPRVTLELATPPFTEDASGLPIQVTGQRVFSVRFEGMHLYDKSGTPTLRTARRLDQEGTVRTLVNAGEFEGVSTWLVGFDGPGCVTGMLDFGSGGFVVTIAPPD